MTTVEERAAPSTTAELQQAGRSARDRVALADHADLALPDRDPVAILAAQNATREPDLVDLRMARMLEGPFAFYRGTAALQATDLARGAATGFRVLADGDAHLANFGVFASPERSLVFDLNDFDEAGWAPWEWDVKRLAGSAVLGARDQGADKAAAEGAGVPWRGGGARCRWVSQRWSQCEVALVGAKIGHLHTRPCLDLRAKACATSARIFSGDRHVSAAYGNSIEFHLP